MFSMMGMGETSSSKRRANEELPMLTPPTPRVNSFSQSAGSAQAAANCQPSQTASAATTTRVTPPSTASPLKRPRDSTTPERPDLNHNGVSWFATLDPPVTDLLASSTSSSQHSHESRTSSTPSRRSSPRDPESSRYSNNTIINSIRRLGYLQYLQKVNLPEVLPAKLRATPITPDPEITTPPTPSPKRRRKGLLTRPCKGKKSAAAANTRKPTVATNTRKPSVAANTRKPSAATNTRKPVATVAQPHSMKRRASEIDSKNQSEINTQTPSKKRKLSETDVKKPSGAINQTPTRKRKLSELEPSSVSKSSPAKARKSEDLVVAKAHEEPPPKKAKTAPPTTPPTKPGAAKSKSRKTPKKTTTTGTSKPEKSRTKEQRWGDYLKNVVGGDKDAYQKLPDLAIPLLGNLIDQVPVRSYTFNKGKVQDYGDGQGLHTREMELAREVGLSYNAYRQQKRMAFIGYAAMQLEGKKDFKKSHTQSMCNIDGNKATHLWVHFHDCWGWMPENPTPAITIASLGDLQLPDLNVAQPQQ